MTGGNIKQEGKRIGHRKDTDEKIWESVGKGRTEDTKLVYKLVALVIIIIFVYIYTRQINISKNYVNIFFPFGQFSHGSLY